MGTDKALLMFDGKTFLEQLIDLMRPLCSSLMISGENVQYKKFGLPLVADELQDSGAIGGLYSALKASQTDWNLVLSCDAPLVDRGIIERLQNHIHPQQKVVHAITEKDAHPLVGFYHKSCADGFLTAIKVGNLKLQPAVNKCNPHKVLFEGEQAVKLQNINTPEDYQSLLNLYG